MLCLRGFILKPRERAWILLKTVVGIFKRALRLRNWHVFMWQPLEILNVFTTLSLKLIFENLFKKLEYRFLVQSTRLKAKHFHRKLTCQKSMSRQIEWEVQNGPITKDGVLPLPTLVFWKFCFRVRSFSKELIRFTNYPTVHIHIFRMRWSFIWRCFFPVSMFNDQLILKYQKPTPKLQIPNESKCLKTVRTDSSKILNKYLFLLGICITHLYPNY